jgi:hypothetical protein
MLDEREQILVCRRQAASGSGHCTMIALRTAVSDLRLCFVAEEFVCYKASCNPETGFTALLYVTEATV